MLRPHEEAWTEVAMICSTDNLAADQTKRVVPNNVSSSVSAQVGHLASAFRRPSKLSLPTCALPTLLTHPVLSKLLADSYAIFQIPDYLR